MIRPRAGGMLPPTQTRRSGTDAVDRHPGVRVHNPLIVDAVHGHPGVRVDKSAFHGPILAPTTPRQPGGPRMQPVAGLHYAGFCRDPRELLSRLGTSTVGGQSSEQSSET